MMDAADKAVINLIHTAFYQQSPRGGRQDWTTGSTIDNLSMDSVFSQDFFKLLSLLKLHGTKRLSAPEGFVILTKICSG